MAFEGRVALITGAARGIGKAIALAFAREKADVVINDISPEEELKEIEREISSAFGARCFAVRADVSQWDQVNNMVSQVERTFQRLDILVNNAGIIRRGSIERLRKTNGIRSSV